jgi:hypothetical protein
LTFLHPADKGVKVFFAFYLDTDKRRTIAKSKITAGFPREKVGSSDMPLLVAVIAPRKIVGDFRLSGCCASRWLEIMQATIVNTTIAGADAGLFNGEEAKPAKVKAGPK